MDYLINTIISIVFLFLGWVITHVYYKKSLKDQALAWEKANSQILKMTRDSKSNQGLILYEQRINDAITDYKKRGTPKYLIDTFDDLLDKEKAKMYDDVLLRTKGRKGKNNPYIIKRY